MPNLGAGNVVEANGLADLVIQKNVLEVIALIRKEIIIVKD